MFPLIYNPRDWYWIVAGDESRVWSSRRKAYVPDDDEDYGTFLALGRRPTRIASEAELAAVLERAVPGWQPAPAAAHRAARLPPLVHRRRAGGDPYRGADQRRHLGLGDGRRGGAGDRPRRSGDRGGAERFGRRRPADRGAPRRNPRLRRADGPRHHHRHPGRRCLDYLLGIKDGRVGRLPGAALGGEGSFGEWWLSRLGTDPAAAIQTLLDAANAAAARAALGIVNGVEGIETIPGGIAVGAADKLYLAVNADGFWITSNARWDGAAWQRINVAKWAFGLNIRTLQLLPFEAATGGIIFWKCPPGANPINPTYAAADGWQNGFIMTEFGDLVIGGFGIEMDGSGTFPYGRIVHYSDAGAGPHLTGILTNLFLDFAAVDDVSKPSWFFGRKDDSFVVARAAAAATGVGSLVNLLALTSAGDLDAATLRATGGFLRLAAGSNVAGLTADASYLYAKDPAGTNRLIIGKAGVDNRVLVDLQNDSDAALVVRNASGVAKFSIDATGAMTAGTVPMARFNDVSAFAKTLLDDADAAAARATLGVGEGGRRPVAAGVPQPHHQRRFPNVAMW